MKRILLAAVALSAALAQHAGGAAARPADAADGRAQRSRQKPAARKKAGAKATAPKQAAAQISVAELKEAGLRDLLGASAAKGKPLVINFWATWCVPCREEFPDLVKIRGEYPADRLDFVLVSLDDISDISKAVPDFLREARAQALTSYLLNANDSDAAIDLVDRQWHGELPATFLFDREGKQVFNHKGRVKPDELRAAIDKALGGKQDAPAPK